MALRRSRPYLLDSALTERRYSKEDVRKHVPPVRGREA